MSETFWKSIEYISCPHFFHSLFISRCTVFWHLLPSLIIRNYYSQGEKMLFITISTFCRRWKLLNDWSFLLKNLVGFIYVSLGTRPEMNWSACFGEPEIILEERNSTGEHWGAQWNNRKLHFLTVFIFAYLHIYLHIYIFPFIFTYTPLLYQLFSSKSNQLNIMPVIDSYLYVWKLERASFTSILVLVKQK